MLLRTEGLAAGSWAWAVWAAWATLTGVLLMNTSVGADPQHDPIALLGIQSRGQGLIKMCPPGGDSFTMAWQMACGMRRKRSVPDEMSVPKQAEYRPLSMTEMMRFCCQFGCSFRDLLPYCDPFGQWDS